ncbi:MAG TPA: hypothetical protein VK673_09195 [Chthoniobacterales bacterium]|nr:hypothetical protein [Chthoniobacterales bacterium]
MAASLLNTGRVGEALSDTALDAGGAGDASATEGDVIPEKSDVSTAWVEVARGVGEDEVICADFCWQAARESEAIAKGAISDSFMVQLKIHQGIGVRRIKLLQAPEFRLRCSFRGTA